MKIEEQIAIMQAFADGKEIEIYDGLKNEWVDIEIPNWDWSNCVYRIKSEPKLRPYTFEELQAEMAKGKIAVRKGDFKCILTITQVMDDYGEDDKIKLSTDRKISYQDLSEYYRWLDGSPCGVIEEE